MTTKSLQGVLKQTLVTPSLNNVVTPSFFRLGNEDDRGNIYDLLQRKPYIRVFDTIDEQLTELVKSFFPKKTPTPDEIELLVDKHLDGTPKTEYGVWVYYPWNETLVHILDEDEFVAMRTNRNRYKITAEEQSTLMKKKVGVIGLSVGQSVSLTLCIERGCGELRIADFDELEITNLNRLRSGIGNMGLKKTVIVAREIAEIDPFLKVTCFHEGVTTETLDDFLLRDGKLDLLIDECDGVDIKVNCRVAAKRHGIPVLMEASDRGTVDVERFDLTPERPILHGFVEHLDISDVGSLKTNEEKLPYILAFAGVETLSVRMKASAMEVGQTISTWPQLASAVTMGGGITADVSRRILLDQFHQSGRYFIDIEELIGDPASPPLHFSYHKKSLDEDEIARVANGVRLIETDIADEVDLETIKELVGAAIAAPSPGNNQPWKWYFDGLRLHLFHDIERSESFGDFKNVTSYMTFGTVVENLRLKARELGFSVVERYFPTANQELHVGIFGFVRKPLEKDKLVDFVGVRCTNRHRGNGTPIKSDVLAALEAASSTVEGIQLSIVDDREKLDRLADIAGKSEKLRLFIPQGHHELFEREVRWSAEEAEQKREGLDLRSLELSAKDHVGFRASRDWNAIKLLADWEKGEALEQMTAKLVATSSAVGLISARSIDATDCLSVGSAMQRLWLAASEHMVSIQPILAPVLHFARINHGMGDTMPNRVEREFRNLNLAFNELFELNENTAVPLFFFRMFYGENPTVQSIRLGLDDVLLT